MSKSIVRQTMLARRRSISSEDFAEKSLAIQNSFAASAEYAAARTIVLYMPVHCEVDTGFLIDCAMADQKTVFLPVVTGNTLEFRRLTGKTELRKGTFGILEPCATSEICRPNELDLFVLPAVAFDMRGYRVGYGKGYYDRTLHGVKRQVRLVGFCFDFQLLDEITGEPHDVKVDLVVTEKRIVRTVCP